MVKTPKTRHSKEQRGPLTIELGPDAVKRIEEPGAVAGADPVAGAASEVVSGSAAVPDDGSFSGPEPSGETSFEQASEPAHEPERDFIRGAGGDPAAPAEDADRVSAADPQAATDEQRLAATDGGIGDEAAVQAGNGDPSARRGGRSLLAAGFVGGVAVFALIYGLRAVGLVDVPGKGGEDLAAVETLRAEVAALKQEVAGLRTGGDAGLGDDVTAIAQVVDALKAEIATLRQAVEAGGAGEGAASAALEARLQAVEGQVTALAQGGTVDLSAVEARIAAAETLARSAGEAGSALQDRVAQIEQALSLLSEKVDAQGAQPKIALAIASAALRSAIERGGAFLAEMETFAAVAPDAPELAALRGYAEAGIASRADIAAGMERAAAAMIAAGAPENPDAGFFERLLDSARSLVSVRPVGDVAGPGVPETVARMEVAVKAGDLDKAMTEFDTLPEAVKAAGSAYAETIRARLEVERLVDAAVASAMKAA